MNPENGTFTVGQIGYGFAGGLHHQVLRPHPSVVRTTVYDKDPTKQAQALGDHLAVTSTLQELLNMGPDILVMALPPGNNLEVIQEVLAHDPRPRAILLEKPLAVTLEDAQQIARLVADTDTMVMMGLTGHYHPEFQRARELLQAKAIGKILTVNEQIYLGGPGLPLHYLNPSYGGIVTENGVHALDHQRYLTGNNELKVEKARVGNDQWGQACPDWAAFTLTCPHMAQVSLLWPKTVPIGLDGYRVDIVGDKGWLRIWGFEGVECHTAEGDLRETFHQPEDALDLRHLPGLRNQFADLINAIQANEPSPIPVPYGLELQRYIHEIHELAGFPMPRREE